jgi:hypothetical protein
MVDTAQFASDLNVARFVDRLREDSRYAGAARLTAPIENRKARVARRKRKTWSQPLVAAAKGPSNLIGPSIRKSKAKIIPQVMGRLVASTPVVCAAAATGRRLAAMMAAKRFMGASQQSVTAWGALS